MFGLALVGTFAAALVPASGAQPAVPHLDKLIHALAFALLAWLGVRAELQSHVALGLGLLAFGAAIEVAQGFTATRHAEWADLAADGFGALVLLLGAGRRAPGRRD